MVFGNFFFVDIWKLLFYGIWKTHIFVVFGNSFFVVFGKLLFEFFRNSYFVVSGNSFYVVVGQLPILKSGHKQISILQRAFILVIFILSIYIVWLLQCRCTVMRLHRSTVDVLYCIYNNINTKSHRGISYHRSSYAGWKINIRLVSFFFC